MTGDVVGLDHVQVAAPPGCEDEARGFYGDLLGLEEVEKPPLLAVRGGVWFRAGAHELHVGVTDDFSPATKAHPALRVATSEGLAAIAERLEQEGRTVTFADPGEIPGTSRLNVHDPWGNRLELVVRDDAGTGP